MFVGRSARPAGMQRLPAHVDGLSDDVTSVVSWQPVAEGRSEASPMTDMLSEKIGLEVDNSV